MNRSKLNRIWAKDSDIVRRDPGDEKYNQGWIAEIPTYQVLNYLQYKIDMTLLAIAERGIAEWGSDVEYGNGSVAWDESDKTIYIATVGKPDRNKKPSSNPAHWSPSAIQVSRLEFDKITNAINNHIADVTSNPHKVTANGIGAYTKAEINKIVDTYNALVASHANDKNNPHGTKAVDIGAVPVTGGKYTGNVIFDKGIFFDDAGKVKLRVDTYTDGSEVYLVNGDWLLGMYRSGKPVVGKSGAMAELITEKNFADFKVKYQGDYAVPTPLKYIPLMSDLNILIGPGEVYSPTDPAFVQYGGLSLTTNGNKRIETSVVDGNKEFTLSFNIRTDNRLNEPGTMFVVSILQGGKWLIALGADLRLTFYGLLKADQVQTTIPRGLVTLTFVQKSNGYVAIYVDGKLVVSKTSTSEIETHTNITNAFMNRYTQGQKENWFSISNIKYWNQALTDKQISMI